MPPDFRMPLSLNVVVFSLLHAVSGVVESPEPQCCILCSRRPCSVQLRNAFNFFFQIIMARPAGGPKPPQGKKDFDEDDWGWCLSSYCSFNPRTRSRGFAKHFLLVYLKRDSLVFVATATSWLSNYVEAYGWHCLLFTFLVPNKRHLLSHVHVFWYRSLFNAVLGLFFWFLLQTSLVILKHQW